MTKAGGLLLVLFAVTAPGALFGRTLLEVPGIVSEDSKGDSPSAMRFRLGAYCASSHVDVQRVYLLEWPPGMRKGARTLFPPYLGEQVQTARLLISPTMMRTGFANVSLWTTIACDARGT